MSENKALVSWAEYHIPEPLPTACQLGNAPFIPVVVQCRDSNASDLVCAGECGCNRERFPASKFSAEPAYCEVREHVPVCEY